MQPVSSVRTVTRIWAGNPGYRFIVPDGDFPLRQELVWKEKGKEENHVKDVGTRFKRI